MQNKTLIKYKVNLMKTNYTENSLAYIATLS